MKTNFATLGATRLRLWPVIVFMVCDLLAGHAQARRGAHRHGARHVGPSDADRGAVNKTAASMPTAGATPKALPATPRVMLWRLNGLGLSEGIRRNLEALVLSHLRHMPQKVVIEPDLMRQKLSEPAFADLERCNDGPGCLQQRGAALSADIVVYGTISALGNDYSLNLRALNVADGQELGRQVATLSGNLDQLIPQMRLVTFALLAPDAIWGSIMIDTALAGIEVHVDGIKQATTPWDAPLDHLKPGHHTVRLDGFTSTHSEVRVEVVAFETSQVQVEIGRNAASEITSVPSSPSTTIDVPKAVQAVAPVAPQPPTSPKVQ